MRARVGICFEYEAENNTCCSELVGVRPHYPDTSSDTRYYVQGMNGMSG